MLVCGQELQECNSLLGDQYSSFSKVWFDKKYSSNWSNFFFIYRDSDGSKINYMYAQYVKNTMEPLNIPDVTNLMSDQRFPWTVSNPKKTNSSGNSYI